MGTLEEMVSFGVEVLVAQGTDERGSAFPDVESEAVMEVEAE